MNIGGVWGGSCGAAVIFFFRNVRRCDPYLRDVMGCDEYLSHVSHSLICFFSLNFSFPRRRANIGFSPFPPFSHHPLWPTTLKEGWGWGNTTTP